MKKKGKRKRELDSRKERMPRKRERGSASKCDDDFFFFPEAISQLQRPTQGPKVFQDECFDRTELGG